MNKCELHALTSAYPLMVADDYIHFDGTQYLSCYGLIYAHNKITAANNASVYVNGTMAIKSVYTGSQELFFDSTCHLAIDYDYRIGPVIDFGGGVSGKPKGVVWKKGTTVQGAIVT